MHKIWTYFLDWLKLYNISEHMIGGRRRMGRLEVIDLASVPRCLNYIKTEGTRKIVGYPSAPIYGSTKVYLEVS
jgi:hypothetical protein